MERHDGRRAEWEIARCKMSESIISCDRLDALRMERVGTGSLTRVYVASREKSYSNARHVQLEDAGLMRSHDDALAAADLIVLRTSCARRCRMKVGLLWVCTDQYRHGQPPRERPTVLCSDRKAPDRDVDDGGSRGRHRNRHVVRCRGQHTSPAPPVARCQTHMLVWSRPAGSGRHTGLGGTPVMAVGRARSILTYEHGHLELRSRLT